MSVMSEVVRVRADVVYFMKNVALNVRGVY